MPICSEASLQIALVSLSAVYLMRPCKVGPHQQQHQADVEERHRLENV